MLSMASPRTTVPELSDIKFMEIINRGILSITHLALGFRVCIWYMIQTFNINTIA